MLTWLAEELGGLVGTFAFPIWNGLKRLFGGIVGLLDLIFGNVGRAWDDLTRAIRTFEQVVSLWTGAIIGQIVKIVTYYIPTFAMTAWWWVTHPDELAHRLLWYVLKWLEREAWTAAQYLGEFILALLVRNLRRVLLVLETVVAAIL